MIGLLTAFVLAHFDAHFGWWVVFGLVGLGHLIKETQ